MVLTLILALPDRDFRLQNCRKFQSRLALDRESFENNRFEARVNQKQVGPLN